MRNYFKEMQTGLYDVYLDRTALVTTDGMDSFVYTSKLSNDGSIVYIEDDIIKASVSILTMIDVHDRGYSIQIKNKKLINEIVDIIYNHLSACIVVKQQSLDNSFTVNIGELIKMERFMMDVIKANPLTIKDTIATEMAIRDKQLLSRFSDVDNDEPSDVISYEHFRRIGVTRDDDFSMEDLLNTL